MSHDKTLEGLRIRREQMEQQAKLMSGYFWPQPQDMEDGVYRLNLYRHPLFIQIYELTQQIEKCGASPELTEAVIKASALNESVAKLIDERDKLLRSFDEVQQDLTATDMSLSKAKQDLNSCRDTLESLVNQAKQTLDDTTDE